jgi:hypothetical protein
MAAFGTDENLRCITDIELKGPEGEDLCLGYKTSVTLVGGPVWIKDDGYVLVIKPGNKAYFPMPEGAELTELQTRALIPDPLPEYELTTGQLFFGTITWWVLIGAVGIGLFSYWRGRHRRAFLAEEGAPSQGPPELRTDQDRWLRDQIMDHLPKGEEVMQQAYCFSSDPSQSGVVSVAKRKARYVGLSAHTLVVLETRLGAFGPLLEVDDASVYPCRDLLDVRCNEDVMVLDLADGTTLELWPEPKQKHFSNQWRFSRDVPRLLAVQLEESALAAEAEA